MDNKSTCGCGCGGKSRFRLIVFALLFIVLATVGISRMFKEDFSEQQPIAPANETDAAGDAETSSLPLILNPQKVSEAKLIPTALISVNLAEFEDTKEATLMLIPQAEWQGDFNADRVAATLLACYKSKEGRAIVASMATSYKSENGQNAILDIYLLPFAIENEELFDEVALGKLLIDMGNSENNLLLTTTRGYLPQEIEFIKQWDKMSPDFIQNGILNKDVLTQAIIEKIGTDASGMSYPILKAKQVRNLRELLEGDTTFEGNI